MTDMQRTARSSPIATARAVLAHVTPARAEVALAAVVVVVGVLGALTTLGRGAWLDEFWTLVSSMRGMSAAEFLDMMSREVHPILHYGLAFVAQAAGMTDLAALRSLNIVGVPVAIGVIAFVLRRGAITRSQACVIAALYASSAFFLDYFAELRAYFLVHSFSLAATLLWRAMARDGAAGRSPGLGVLVAWGLTLAVLVNLHYFATLMGGMLTAGLMLKLGLRRSVPLALVSLAAAAPAIGMGLIHAGQADLGIVSWIQTGRIDAAFVALDILWMGMAHNLVAAGCAIAAALYAVERGGVWRERSDEVVLAAMIAAYFGLLLTVNLVKPIIIDRYLIASSGPVIVATGLLVAGVGAPRWAAAAACLFALLTQARNLYDGAYQRPGWDQSAELVVDLAQDCPSTKVFIEPSLEQDPENLLSVVRRYGLGYYAELYDLDVTELRPGDLVAAGEACPSLVWMEHVGEIGPTTAAQMLERARLEWRGSAEMLRVGRGAVVIVR